MCLFPYSSIFLTVKKFYWREIFWHKFAPKCFSTKFCLMHFIERSFNNGKDFRSLTFSLPPPPLSPTDNYTLAIFDLLRPHRDAPRVAFYMAAFWHGQQITVRAAIRHGNSSSGPLVQSDHLCAFTFHQWVLSQRNKLSRIMGIIPNSNLV